MKPVFEFSLFEPRWHGWARWQLRKLEYHADSLLIVRAQALCSGWTRRPRGSEYLVARSYHGAGLPWLHEQRIIDAIDEEIARTHADEYIDGLESAKKIIIGLDKRA